MKNISKFCLALFTFSMVVSCSDDTEIAPFKPLIFSEDFPEEEINFNATFDFEGWTNFAEAGTKLWIERDFNNDGYIQFSSFGSGEASNIGWAITPAITLPQDANAVLSFTSATNFVDNPANKLEVFISTDYNGTDVLAATWTQLNAVVADNTTNGYVYIPSGEISLADYSGTVHIAFKATGNGTTLDGLFQVDKIKVYSNN
ncbi:choice-of-anchor J domain-containing protein [Flavobacterium sedimenticola]|uniref:Choice-of-anchor J domain-containing protein n=1 Tax=Flavobacterium sedimenticola TaxID=3043286 RepID=A0ABT6XMV2_9FLAO|nr:choice-of-anchor J domain-containing protein [Flavobacterium sedimenticola]MDI9256009.1 choice-of-anchor J domain-containing protein [Flavobacterium sedimenticola]